MVPIIANHMIQSSRWEICEVKWCYIKHTAYATSKHIYHDVYYHRDSELFAAACCVSPNASHLLRQNQALLDVVENNKVWQYQLRVTYRYLTETVRQYQNEIAISPAAKERSCWKLCVHARTPIRWLLWQGCSGSASMTLRILATRATVPIFAEYWTARGDPTNRNCLQFRGCLHVQSNLRTPRIQEISWVE